MTIKPPPPWKRRTSNGEWPGDICCQRGTGKFCYEHDPANYKEQPVTDISLLRTTADEINYDPDAPTIWATRVTEAADRIESLEHQIERWQHVTGCITPDAAKQLLDALGQECERLKGLQRVTAEEVITAVNQLSSNLGEFDTRAEGVNP